MKKFIQIALFITITNLSFAQDDVIFSFGKKHPWVKNNSFLEQYIKHYNTEDSIYYRIPVTFWIYSTDKGYFGASPTEIKQQITFLNYYFNVANKTGIEFYVADVININSTKHKKMGYTIESTYLTMGHHHEGTVNVHLVDKLSFRLLSKKISFGGTYNYLTRSIIISRNNLPTGLAHEMGHFLCLEHPHKNWNKGKRKAEAVSRTMTLNKRDSVRNCEARGDCLCDTPAEPDLSTCLDDSCHYIGNYTDPWGEPYKPDTHNLMSYQSNKKCRHQFTNMQIAVMLYCASQNKYAYGWETTPQNISYNFDDYEPDDNWITGTWLYPGKKQYHTFHLIFNGKKDPKTNSVDIFKFAPADDKKSYLVFTKGRYAFPMIQMEVYDAFMKKIYSTEVTDPATIKLPLTDSDVIYIVLKLQNRYEPGQLFDYNVVINNF